jgi:tripartite-type tricarboxylate transporter receptor subunit TctC
MRKLRLLAMLLLVAAAARGFAAPVPEPSYPNKPIRMLVPTPPGGGNDIMARLIGQKLSDAWGYPVVVDNRPGAGGAIAMELVAHATADGHTLLLGTTNLTVLPSMTRVNFHPTRDFAPVALIATASNILLVHPSVPAKSLKELLALARAKPGNLNYASGSIASSTHLAAELLNSMARISIMHVPYKGAGPALTDLLAGQVQMMFCNPAACLPYVRSGKLRALAVTSTQRLPELPDLPTVAESGLPGYEASTWWGVLAPWGTSTGVVNKLNSAIAEAIAAGDVRNRIAALGAQPAGGPAQVLAAHIAGEMPKWSRLIKEAGIRLE